jgi:hypothetical protein
MRLRYHVLWLGLLVASTGCAQDQEPSSVMFPHPDDTRWWISGQVNVVFQAHPPFEARYSGPNSLRPHGEHATSRVLTLYTGFALTRTTEVFADVEEAGGRGISDALGLAGYTNLDVVRNPTIGEAPYLARLMVRQMVPLSDRMEKADRDGSNLATQVSERRLEFRAGKFSAADFFDVNGVGSDSHLQFLNWTIDNNGAYDYAADTRGYSWGLIAEYESPKWAARFGEMLMPKVANGPDLEWNIRKARAENIEFDFRPALLGAHKTVIRLLSFVNHANMGTYQHAIARYRDGIDPRPIIENTRVQGTVKYGFGLNLEQELPRQIRAYGRFGWNEGQHESFAYTEVDQTTSGGADIALKRLHRPLDRWGTALVSNGISRPHQEYLRLGGLGFLLGDGNLTYGRENILETYYTLHIWRGAFFAFDLQRIWNPGYNRDRGPVIVPGLRVHLDF